MKRTYFKHRYRFDFSQYTFDIGRPLFWHKEFEDNHVLYRLYHLKESDYPTFYKYHLDYFFNHNEKGQEQEFFQHLYGIISDALDELKVKDRYNSNHGTDVRNKEILKGFMDFMKSIDQWKTDKSKDNIIVEQQEEILKFRNQLGEAKQELKDARKLETADYINITDGYRNTLLDLYLQLQEIKLPNGKELLLSQTQSVWMKMICKYFREGDQEINFETIRRYFPGDKREPGDKHSPIPVKSHLYHIGPAKKHS